MPLYMLLYTWQLVEYVTGPFLFFLLPLERELLLSARGPVAS